MPILPLTARTVAGLRAPYDQARIEYFDAETPGLCLRITSDGVKTWALIYRHHGRKRRLTLGRFPDLGLADARGKAVRARGRILGGADPAAEKHDERATYGDTVDITRREIRDLVEQKAKTAPIMAHRLLARISRLFTFALERDWIQANPTFRMRRPSPETSRDRVLSRSELKKLWRVLHQTDAKDAQGRSLPRLSQTLNDAFLVLLLTAQRGGEVWRMRWEEVDLQTGWWTLPAESTKNADPHRGPLTQPVVDILKRRWRTRDDRYVFSNHRHTCVASRAKKAAAILCNTKQGGLTFHFRAHDLRRTAASYMGEAGVERFHIAHVLNHRSVTHSTVTAIYDRYRYDKGVFSRICGWLPVPEGDPMYGTERFPSSDMTGIRTPFSWSVSLCC